MSAAGPFEIYFDFDNTITEFDVLDDIIQRFSLTEEWKVTEEEWRLGRIGSRECLERQFDGVRITREALAAYLRTIKVDASFRPILDLLGRQGIEPIIVSDSFSSLIGPILAHNGIPPIKTFSNEMRLEGDRPVVSFPYFNSICSRSGNCKCSHLLRRNRPAGTRKIYVGDGQSDICPAANCEILFAKGSLLRHAVKIQRDCHPFETLDAVHAGLQALLT